MFRNSAMAACGAMLLFAGCAGARRSGDCPLGFERRDAVQEQEIINVLHRQAAAWNEGDVDGYMEPYWHSPDLTFSAGGKVTRGFDATANRFRTAYPDRAAMGRLTFSDLEINMLEPNAAYVLGRWKLDAAPPKSGAFSLVMQRIGGEWVIVHDHTSRDAS